MKTWLIRIGIAFGSLWLVNQFVPGMVKPFMLFVILGTLLYYIHKQGLPGWAKNL